MTDRFAGTVLRRLEQGDTRPTLGEIGLNQFAPYLMNRVMARWNANMSDALKAHDMTTTKMRALAILGISSTLTINEMPRMASARILVVVMSCAFSASDMLAFQRAITRFIR